jgi:hypothetical protein
MLIPLEERDSMTLDFLDNLVNRERGGGRIGQFCNSGVTHRTISYLNSTSFLVSENFPSTCIL